MKISKDILDKLNFVQKNYFLAYCAFYKPSMREREREREREAQTLISVTKRTRQ